MSDRPQALTPQHCDTRLTKRANAAHAAACCAPHLKRAAGLPLGKVDGWAHGAARLACEDDTLAARSSRDLLHKLGVGVDGGLRGQCHNGGGDGCDSADAAVLGKGTPQPLVPVASALLRRN